MTGRQRTSDRAMSRQRNRRCKGLRSSAGLSREPVNPAEGSVSATVRLELLLGGTGDSRTPLRED